jgi:hypothetical protein
MCHANCAGDPIGAPQIRPETKVPIEVWRTRFNRQGNVGEPEWPPAAMLEEVDAEVGEMILGAHNTHVGATERHALRAVEHLPPGARSKNIGHVVHKVEAISPGNLIGQDSAGNIL